MDINIVFKIAAVGILVAVLNQVLVRAGREEQAMMTTLAGLVVVLFWVVQYISDLFQTVQTNSFIGNDFSNSYNSIKRPSTCFYSDNIYSDRSTNNIICFATN